MNIPTILMLVGLLAVVFVAHWLTRSVGGWFGHGLTKPRRPDIGGVRGGEISAEEKSTQGGGGRPRRPRRPGGGGF